MENRHDNDYGLHDPDFIDQQTPAATNPNYTPDDDQYQFQEEFIEDDEHPSLDSNRNEFLRAENIPDQERIVNEDTGITSDGTKNDLDTDNNSDDLDYENDLEKDGDLDNDEELSDFDAEHYPENHPRE